ncbi:MAG: 50S ribosomal protein L22 [Parcubacteria group bacterium GW2011_GWA2_31_28]|nr:MAG: 50S ribosomal protein L22 [Parcubacteria group bacterium GW2011_GWA2_31_28]
MINNILVKASLRYLKMSPRKVRLVADLVRNMNFIDAKAQLRINPRRASKPILKLLDSAEASAKHNFSLNKEDLSIFELRVDEGPRLKRLFYRSRGRADVKQKRMSHVSLILSNNNIKEETQSTENKAQTKHKSQKNIKDQNLKK